MGPLARVLAPAAAGAGAPQAPVLQALCGTALAHMAVPVVAQRPLPHAAFATDTTHVHTATFTQRTYTHSHTHTLTRWVCVGQGR